MALPTAAVGLAAAASSNGTGLSTAVDGVRLSLHVAAAAIWVGGQLTLAGLVPTARGFGQEAPAALGRAFARIMWPAYVVLLGTGIWNVSAVSSGQPSAWKTVLSVKIVVVLAAGAAAWIHTRAKTRGAIATWGAVSALTSVTALVLGVFLAG